MIISNIYLQKEKKLLKMNIEIQRAQKKTILKYIDEIADNALNTFKDSTYDFIYNYLLKVQSSIEKSDENISMLNVLLNKLDSFSSEDENNFITSYNEDYITYHEKILDNTLEIQKILADLLEYIKFDFSSLNTKNETEIENIPSDVSINTNTEISPNEYSITAKDTNLDNDTVLQENTLIISHTRQKVILPYTKSELEKILKEKNNDYKNLQEIVDDKYTLPISYYKNIPLSRFKEAYSLAKFKAHASVKQALDLGLELFFNSDLHPAIITACRTLDELDIYLDYLESGEIEKFKCFSIIFEIPPVIQQKKYDKH